MTDKDKLAEEILKTPQEWCKDCVIGNHHRHETKKLIKLAIEAGRQASDKKIRIDHIDNKVICDFCNQQKKGFIINRHDIGIETHRLCYECYTDPYGFVKRIKAQAKSEGRQIGYGEGYEDGKRNVLMDILKHGSWLRVKELAKELKVKR